MSHMHSINKILCSEIFQVTSWQRRDVDFLGAKDKTKRDIALRKVIKNLRAERSQREIKSPTPRLITLSFECESQQFLVIYLCEHFKAP